MTKTVAVDDVARPEILDEVEKHHVEVVVTRGEPIARVMPIETPLRGPMYGTLTFHGDITEPLGEEWDVDK
jgi:antitoxin (DNA-binding transcriptional repressor) of toxin-antitoxin stability system